ncbi:hypothetical protein [Actinokineospora xionganensis]|uniref:Right handed beta helix region n=1 Tax=Actinokineospora xionganensis TaxID=2684470 RepID=A0ABR7L2D9_9PSEU|nr:hypothetical protein [Actinokineospora xionganensis]MBC6446599.1 hypothetical protein [Actinokineospora xionganensis]
MAGVAVALGLAALTVTACTAAEAAVVSPGSVKHTKQHKAHPRFGTTAPVTTSAPSSSTTTTTTSAPTSANRSATSSVVPTTSGSGTTTSAPAAAPVAGCAGAMSPTGLAVNAAAMPKRDTMSITQAGAVVENVDVSRYIDITASNVTVRNVRVRGNGGPSYGIYIQSGVTGTRLENIEIGGGDNGTTKTGVDVGVLLPSNSGGAGSNKATRVWVHHTLDGFRLDGNGLISCSRVSSLDMAPGAHGDGVQSTGWSGSIIQDSYIEGGSNAPIFFNQEGGNPPIVGAQVLRNRIVGMSNGTDVSSFGLYVNGGTNQTRAIGNVFAGSYQGGPVNSNATFAEFSGNTWADGRPITR